MDKVIVNHTMEQFRQHLVKNYSAVFSAYEVYCKTTENRPNLFIVDFDDFYSDWAQANWELLVERIFCGIKESLVIYGSGSDFEAASHSRVFFNSRLATHKIMCSPKTECVDALSKKIIDLDGYEFDCFVCAKNGWFQPEPPFDHILFESIHTNKDPVLINVKAIDFSFVKIEI